MELLFKITKNLEITKKSILNDDILSRASIIFKESSTLGEKESFYYLLFSGTEDQCEKAKEILKDKAEVVDKKDIIKKIKEEQDKAAEGFGSIFS